MTAMQRTRTGGSLNPADFNPDAFTLEVVPMPYSFTSRKDEYAYAVKKEPHPFVRQSRVGIGKRMIGFLILKKHGNFNRYSHLLTGHKQNYNLYS
jgi:hypothetical protein